LVPSAHEESEVYFAWVCRPTTFRLQGLANLLAVCSLRVPASLFSCRRRSWDSPFGGFPSRKVSSAFPPKMRPPTVPLSGIPAAEAPGRPDEFRFLGFSPSESPLWLGRCLAYRPPDPPLDFALPGFARGNLGRDSARPPLTRFAKSATNRRPRRRPRVSIGFCLVLTFHCGKPQRGGQDNPYRVSAPA
jgi:hypothetical protein